MYPILFSLGPVTVTSYFAFWGAGLVLFVLWSQRRATKLFGFPPHKSALVIAWIYCAAILGGFFGNIAERLLTHSELGAFTGGMSSAPAILCAGLAGLYMLHKTKLPIDIFAEATALPFALLIAIGRVGCFLQGCCQGKSMAPVEIMGVTFTRIPTELFESATGWVMLLILFLIEKTATVEELRAGKRGYIFPLLLFVYSLHRIIFDSYRMREGIASYYAILAIFFALFWIGYSIYIKRYSSLEK